MKKRVSTSLAYFPKVSDSIEYDSPEWHEAVWLSKAFAEFCGSASSARELVRYSLPHTSDKTLQYCFSKNPTRAHFTQELSQYFIQVLGQELHITPDEEVINYARDRANAPTFTRAGANAQVKLTEQQENLETEIEKAIKDGVPRLWINIVLQKSRDRSEQDPYVRLALLYYAHFSQKELPKPLADFTRLGASLGYDAEKVSRALNKLSELGVISTVPKGFVSLSREYFLYQ